MWRAAGVRAAETPRELGVGDEGRDLALAVQAHGGATGDRLSTVGTRTRRLDLDVCRGFAVPSEQCSQATFHIARYAVGMVI